jgi:hypothetical protein
MSVTSKKEHCVVYLRETSKFIIAKTASVATGTSVTNTTGC